MTDDNAMSMGEYEEAYGALDVNPFPQLPPIRELGEKIPWPEAGCTTYCNGPGGRYYRALHGEFPKPLPGVTTVEKIIGTGTNALIAWSANTERAAVLEAAGDVFAEGKHDDGPAGFLAAVEARIGKAKQHQKLVAKAQDIGTAAHAMIQWTLRKELGLPTGPEPVLPDASQWAFMAWQDWWRSADLRPVRCEQVVWDAELGYAGSIDAILEAPDGQLEVWDWKTSKGVYDAHHVQVAAYCHAARNWAPVRPGGIVRIPKNVDDPAFEVKRLGEMYGGKTLTEEQLMDAFRGALACWRVLMGTA